MDSAVMHLRTLQSAQQRAQQLEAVYQVDRIRDGTKETRRLLIKVVHMAVDALNADVGLIGLINEESGQNELRAVEDRKGHRADLRQADVLCILEWAMARPGVGVLERDCAPLGFGEGHLVHFGLNNCPV
jgi:hypothetical protein